MLCKNFGVHVVTGEVSKSSKTLKQLLQLHKERDQAVVGV